MADDGKRSLALDVDLGAFSLKGERSLRRGGSKKIATGREAGGFMLGSIFVHMYSVWSTQIRTLNL